MPKRPRAPGGGSSDSDSEPEDDENAAASQSEDEQPTQQGAAGRMVADPDPDYNAFGGADPLDEEDDGEDLIGDGMEADYRPMGALDEYEADGLDFNEYEGMDFGARAAADAALDARDARERVSRMPRALLTSDDDDGEDRAPRRGRRGRGAYEAAEGRFADADEAAAAGLEDFLEDDEVHINLEDYQCPLAEWIASQPVGDEVRRRFRRFLLDAETGAAYADKVRRMCAANSESLEVNYHHLSQAVPILAIWVADAPKEMLKLLDEAAMDTVRIMFPDYEQIHQTVHVRITDLPIEDPIRDLRQAHVNCLVKVSGVVTRRSPVFPQLKHCKYTCTNCSYVLGPFAASEEGEHRMRGVPCPSCQSKGPYVLNHEETVYCNYQKITLQESPGSVPPGRLPRHKEVILQFDLIDIARPGEEIEVTGVYSTTFDSTLNAKSGFPVFATVIEANHVQKREELFSSRMLTDEDKREILKLSKDPQLCQKIIRSVAPSIYGHDDIKTAIALSMFGGVGKDVYGKHRIRGDINVLLLGDPGTAKSQFLKYVEKTSPRAVYTTGQGASAVGLTASVRKDPVTREWMLEGGALVLADQGVCLIDEFDKMNDADRTSIHEAMEQQSISISKAGIVTSLQARCAVIAAANPINGRYNSSRTFGENVELTEPILSRFDCLCVVKDIVDPVQDESLARFVVNSHARSHPDGVAEGDAEADAMSSLLREGDADLQPLQQEQLRKYITYAKSTVKPKLRASDATKIQHVYANLRQTSLRGQGVPVAVRHIESIIRMAESHAKMHLREYVSSSDVDVAIRTLLQSFISTQKDSVQRSLQRSFQQYLGGASDYDELLMHALKALVRDAVTLAQVQEGAVPAAVAIPLENLEAKAAEHEITDLQPFLRGTVFDANGFEFKPDERVILKDIAA